MNSKERRWLKVSEVAEILGVSVKGAYALAAAGELPVVRIGRRTIRIDRVALEAQLEAQIEAAAGK